MKDSGIFPISCIETYFTGTPEAIAIASRVSGPGIPSTFLTTFAIFGDNFIKYFCNSTTFGFATGLVVALVGTSADNSTEKQYSNWKDYSRSVLSSFIQDNPLANLEVPEVPNFVKDNPLKESKILREEDKLIDPKNKFKIKDKTKDHKLEKNKKVLLDMLSFYDEKLKFEKPVLISFVDDEENAGKLLGKTAFYDPNKSSIVVFTTNRLLKDILRSLGHELIHHKQHCKDEFHDTQTFEGYAQKDKKLRRKEKEAYLFGNILFRDWEDNYKSNHKETR